MQKIHQDDTYRPPKPTVTQVVLSLSKDPDLAAKTLRKLERSSTQTARLLRRYGP